MKTDDADGYGVYFNLDDIMILKQQLTVKMQACSDKHDHALYKQFFTHYLSDNFKEVKTDEENSSEESKEEDKSDDDETKHDEDKHDDDDDDDDMGPPPRGNDHKKDDDSDEDSNKYEPSTKSQ